MWLHGTGMQIEFPDNIKSVRRAGGGTYIVGKEGTTNVFHFPIPTPVIINDHRLRVGSVLLKCVTGSNHAAINTVNINDGKVLLKSYDNLNLIGNIGLKRFDVPNSPEVQLGVDIVVHVSFPPAMEIHPDDAFSMTFEAAGCDFLP